MMLKKRIELDAMSVEDLWSLHVEISQMLQQRIQAEKLKLEERLKQLEVPVAGRRTYPLVPPKYRNPDQPSETCRAWQTAALAGGAVAVG